MHDDTAVTGFSALGNKTRLAVFRVLVRAGEKGLPIGGIQDALGVPLSTLAHHLAALVGAGLVQQEKRGRTVICRADYDRMHALVAYLTENCCEGIDKAPDATVARAAKKEAIEA